MAVEAVPEVDCVLAKITQYRCKAGAYIVCKPIERLFKQCSGAPSVEMVVVDGVYTDVRSLSDLKDWNNLDYSAEKTI
ncbi:hypothetical protein IW143_003393 [Coemansia sp. RSA 520]|nr:hypothetical protein IW143_003393 [Coemansia sp. RSA 520]KAJ2728006.1 hypothetical protein H4S00_001223 [Coemansia sp. D1744]